MQLKILEISFIIFGIISVVNFILLHFGITEKIKPMRASDYISFVSATLLLYVIVAFMLFLVLEGINKFYIIIFALSPLLIGKFAEYKTLSKFTIIQTAIIFCSIIYMSRLL